MPIPQFHRTPKTRKRRARRTAAGQDAETEIIAANDPLTGAPLDAEDPPPSSEELPALLSGWPPQRSK